MGKAWLSIRGKGGLERGMDLLLGSALSGGGFLPLSGEDGPDTVEEVCALTGNGKGWI